MDVVRNAINDVKLGRDARQENVKLSHNPHEDILIKADKGRISQVISNLLNNAIEFTIAGTIHVSIEKDKISNNNDDNETIIVSVNDSGHGIDRSILPRLFTKFASIASIWPILCLLSDLQLLVLSSGAKVAAL